MRLLICGAGSRGDLHPLLALARAFTERGHDVRMLLNPYHEPLVEATGATFVPIGRPEEMQALHQTPRAFTYQHGWKHWIQTCAVLPMRELYRAVIDHYEPGTTVAVGNYLSFGARIAQNHVGIPLATVHMDAHTIRSTREVLALPFPAFTGPHIPRWYLNFQFRLMDQFWIDPLITPKLNSFRSELGLKPVRRIAHTWWHSPQLTLGLFPDWWSQPQPDWPSQCQTTDFLFWENGSDVTLSNDVQEFLDRGSAPIVFTPGNSSMHEKRYFQAAIDSCQALNKRGIIITNRPDLLPPLPDSIRSDHYLPLKPLLRRASFVVHHGGVGTSALCIAAGLPQVVIPTLFNQPDTAKRLERLGVARVLQPWQLTSQSLTAAIRSTHNNPAATAKCKALAMQMDATRGIEATAQRIESLCEQVPLAVTVPQ